MVFELKLRKFKRKIRTVLEKFIHDFSDSDYSLNHRRSRCKRSRDNIIVFRSLQDIYFDIQRKDDANMVFQRKCYRSNDYLSDGDTDDLDIVTGILQEDTLAKYLFLICLDFVQRTSINQMKENILTLNERKCSQSKKG